jgi:hypothetical protein
MANLYRGEAELVLAGKTYTLRLSLGALAELENAFDAEGLAALGQRLGEGHTSARDILRLLVPLLKGGGHPLGAAEVSTLVSAADLPAVVHAISACFAAAMPGDVGLP